jgi:hypothetical protein
LTVIKHLRHRWLPDCCKTETDWNARDRLGVSQRRSPAVPPANAHVSPTGVGRLRSASLKEPNLQTSSFANAALRNGTIGNSGVIAKIAIADVFDTSSDADLSRRTRQSAVPGDFQR